MSIGVSVIAEFNSWRFGMDLGDIGEASDKLYQNLYVKDY